ncbi:hypothetical protein REPUB_Repub09cG0090900 [Reevesia pubescens]
MRTEFEGESRTSCQCCYPPKARILDRQSKDFDFCPFMESGSSFTVFVNNIPPKVHWRWLWRISQHHGQVLDVFISRKEKHNGEPVWFCQICTFLGCNESHFYIEWGLAFGA